MIFEEYTKYERLEEELKALRQTIMQVDPMVMIDGRFEQMICNPLLIVKIAQQMLLEMPAQEPVSDLIV